MKKILSLIVLFSLAILVQAQTSNCYQPNLKKADDLYNMHNYRQAKTWYEKALQCSEAKRYENGRDAKEGIRKCNNKLSVGGVGSNPDNDGDVYPVTSGSNTFSISDDGKGNKDITINGVSFKMIFVEGGTFTMGCDGGCDCEADEYPAHNVTVSGYYISETEVTQALWKAVMGVGPKYNGGWSTGYGLGDNYPAYYISYDDVNVFVKQLSKITGFRFRMPTEAEWEYAARGGKKSSGYRYSGGDKYDKVAWADGCGGLQLVKKRQANELGIYDMSGNVYEWCCDRYGEYNSDSQINPQGPTSGNKRVLRGGDFTSSYKDVRVTNRSRNDATNRGISKGCRLVMEQ